MEQLCRCCAVWAVPCGLCCRGHRGRAGHWTKIKVGEFPVGLSVPRCGSVGSRIPPHVIWLCCGVRLPVGLCRSLVCRAVSHVRRCAS